MNLDEAQRKQVAQWIAQGQKLSEIQNRLAAELGLRLTYMEVRLLVDDLKLTPKDVEPRKPAQTVGTAAPKPGPAAKAESKRQEPPPSPGVSLSVDRVTRPGALVSGRVSFSDANEADWYIDQNGRLGVVPKKQGYRPSAADLQQFQAELEMELARLGL